MNGEVMYSMQEKLIGVALRKKLSTKFDQLQDIYYK